MNNSLYQIKSSYLELMEQVEANGGELTSEMEEALKIKEEQLQSKSLAYLDFIENREYMNQRIDAEIKRLQALKKANNNIIDRLKTNLVSAVQTFGEFTSGLHTFKLRKSESIQISIDEQLLPKEYLTTKVEMKADKNALKKAIKEGKEILGVQLIENLNINIK